MVYPWDLPHSNIECYSGKAGQIDPCCQIVYFPPGVIIDFGVYMSPCIGAGEAFVTLQECRNRLDQLYPPPPPPEDVTVYLQPPLDYARLELRDRSYDRDNLVEYTRTDNGVGYFSGDPYPDWYVYQVRFPPQTVGGVSYLEARTGMFTFQAAPLEYTLILTEALPTSATVTVRGLCTGGYPSPSMLLEIYDKGVKVASIDFGVIVIGNWYEFETGVTGAGVHTVYGRMVLTNPLGTYEFTTPIKEFELG